MAGLTSGSGHSGGAYESYTRGPAGGQTTMRGRGGGGGRGRGFDPSSMAEAMMLEAQSASRSKRRMAEETHAWDMKQRKKKDKPKLGGGKLKKTPMDPMRYANTQRQAARNAQFAKGGMGSYGQGELAMEHQGQQAYGSAMAAYPAYLAMMQD